MTEIIMESKIYIITRILKPTKAKLFKDLTIDDKIQFSSPVRHAGIHLEYIPITVKTTNIKTGDYVLNTFNNLANRLENFELEELVKKL